MDHIAKQAPSQAPMSASAISESASVSTSQPKPAAGMSTDSNPEVRMRGGAEEDDCCFWHCFEPVLSIICCDEYD
ncbi:hypothetical protein ACEPPN_002586 [Leptodophora sp. 'Broadleaf-Isolate-01']